MADPAPLSRNMRGILWALGSVVTASAMTLAVRVLTDVMDSTAITFWRAALATLGFLILIAIWKNGRAQLQFSRPRDHLIRGVFMGVAMQAGFYAIAHLPLATATVLFFTAPIFTVILSVLFAGETVGLRRGGAVATGFLGAVIILWPDEFGGFHPAMLIALGSSFCFAGALAMSRGLAEADGPLSAYISSMAVIAVMSLPLAWGQLGLPHSWLFWAAMAVLVVTGAGRNIADIQSYRYGEAAVVGPVNYLRLVLIGGASWIMFDEVPDGRTFLGAAIIIASTLYISRRGQRLGKAPIGGGGP